MQHRLLATAVAVLLLIGTPLSLGAGKPAAKGASIVLTAKWEGTPLLLEAAEFLADESPDLFWEFIDAWDAAPADAGADCWQRITDTAAQFLSPGLAKVLQVSLGIRQYSARLEMFRQLALEAALAQGACCRAQVAHRVATSAAELDALLADLQNLAAGSPNPATEPALHDFDHSLPASLEGKARAQGDNETQSVNAVLYGALGTACFREMHQRLATAVQATEGVQIVYAVRPVLPEACSADAAPSSAAGGGGECVHLGTGGPLQLPGFGVEMAIKNMEYKAMDDQKAKEGTQAAEARDVGEGEASEVHGFVFGTLLARRPALRQELLTFRDHLLAASNREETLKVWDLKDLGVQASQRVLQAADPLRLLTEIGASFPSLASSLSRVAVNESLGKEVSANARMIPAGQTLMLLNGLMVDAAALDLYSLVDRVRKEVRLVEQLRAAGLQAPDVSAVLRLRASITDSDDVRLDLVSPPGRIIWANDMEADPQYLRWRPSVQDVLMPQMPGQLSGVRKNMYNLVVVGDPTHPDFLAAWLQMHKFMTDLWPLRIGFIPVPPDTLPRAARRAKAIVEPWDTASAAEKLALAAMVAQDAFGGRGTAELLHSVAVASYQLQDAGKSNGTLTWEQVEIVFKEVWSQLVELLDEDDDAADTTAEEVLAELAEGVGVASRAVQDLSHCVLHARAKGLTGQPAPALWFNGQVLEGGPGWKNAMMYALQYEVQRVQEWVYYGTLTDAGDVPTRLMALHKAVPRYNPRILPPSSSAGSMFGGEDDGASEKPHQAALTARQLAGLSVGYLHHPGTEDHIKGITHWLAVDPNLKSGRDLVVQAMQYLEANASAPARVGILYNSMDAEAPPALLERILTAVLQLPSRRAKIPGFLRALFSEYHEELLLGLFLTDDDDSLQRALLLAKSAGLNQKALEGILKDGASTRATAARLRAETHISRTVLKLPAGAAAIATNGRVVVSSTSMLASLAGREDLIVAADFDLMQMYAQSQQLAGGVQELLETALDEGRAAVPGGEEGGEEDLASSEQLSDIAMLVSSQLSAQGVKVHPQQARITEAVEALTQEHCGVSVASPAGNPLGLDLQVVLNPLSKAAQKIAPLVEFMSSALGAAVGLVLHPERQLSDMPLKSYYALALPEFATHGDGLGLPEAPAAVFRSLPPHKVLTLNMDVPEAWLVEPVAAESDLDNLRLQDLDTSMLTVRYELEALMLTGSCIDTAARTRDQVTPRGVQLHLGTAAQPHRLDTLVMANLGYFQLKASPAFWTLRLASGRSAELYSVVDHLNSSDTATSVVVDSFSGKSLQLNVRKRSGREAEDVLGAGTEAGEKNASGVWGAVSKLLHKGGEGGEEEDERIHVFTIASGHMYERLQKIMILSVIRNTKSRVKFWFIKNYMSPQMKRFVPHMAAAYGFDYEFVTYKWPAWLHKQTEKQRLIWAYKILFLDVLFPLGTKKVIFVDADQVVRGDVREVWDMDLKGAPYGYTPLCDGNADMDGFRFWKQGFWKEHLRGRPYHISAFYVVDLVRFRQMAAGDQLRVVYDNLSKDPNSLANLDQDLPNYAQHQVPIFSLPPPWLWCETWCGNATKHQAKTIDLCNNPLTKEPKLDSARRIISEWPALDAEARDFTAKMEAQFAAEDALEEGLPPTSAGDNAAADSGRSAAPGQHVNDPGTEAQQTDGSVLQQDSETPDRSEL